MANDLCFNVHEMAKITKGYWENFDENIHINEFHNIYKYLQKDDVYVVASDNWPNKNAYSSTEHKIKGAISKGISALILKDGVKVDTKIPILRVENTYFAMKALAKYSSKNTQAKKVLIVGSYGKTAFKLHLNHLIKDDLQTYTRTNSANYTATNYCNISSIRKNSEAFLIELPIATKDRLQRRTKLLSPDICVLTSIGHEHIERFKTIENIITNKVSIAASLSKGGKFLVNRDDVYYKDVKKELKKYKDIDIRTYGEESSNNAYILYKKFREFGWDIIAKIENKVVSYRVPFHEEYAPSNSLGVLLCAHYLGADVHKGANRYYNAENFKSSGKLYKANYKNKSFYLYDQSNRGGIEGYKSFFKTLSYLKPNNEGRKFLVTSEFVDYKDGEIKLINQPHFQKLINDANVDILYSVEKFSEHINVLEDKTIWKNHSLDFNNIKDEIIDAIQEDDIVCVKGIFESNLPKFIEYIKKLDGIELQSLEQHNKMKNKNNALKNLRTIEPSDITEFKELVNAENKMGWVYYFPFLYFWSLSNSREILIENKDNKTINIFLLDKFNRSNYPIMQQYIPTLSSHVEEQENALQRIFTYRGRETADIVWVDQKDVSRLKAINNTIIFSYKTFEYLYSPKIYENLAGSKFRNLRQQLTQMSKNENIQTLAYEKKYEKECLELYDRWLETQEDKYKYVSDEKYTKECIKTFGIFDDKDLNGLVVLQNNKVVSFAFVGQVHDEMLSFFIGKSDLSVRGVQSYIRYTLLINNQKYNFANDSVGVSKGLDTSKRMFRPVAKHKVYKARLER